MIRVGFAGCEAFDLILYISRTLVILGYPILIIDFTDSGALKKAIYHGMELESRKEIVNYRNIHYLRRTPVEAELISYEDGLVLINYGLNPSRELLLSCDILLIVMNAYPHMIDKVNALMSTLDWKAEKHQLLIRDIITPDDIDRVISKVRFPYDNKEYYLFLDHNDYFCAVNCQINQSLKFLKLSSNLKKFIIYFIHDIFPQIKINNVKKALTSAGRGR